MQLGEEHRAAVQGGWGLSLSSRLTLSGQAAPSSELPAWTTTLAPISSASRPHAPPYVPAIAASEHPLCHADAGGANPPQSETQRREGIKGKDKGEKPACADLQLGGSTSFRIPKCNGNLSTLIGF